MPALMPSEKPEITRVRHHWIVLFHRPKRWAGVAVLLLVVWCFVSPAMLIVLIVLLATVEFLRWRNWRAELIILTQRRIIRSSGLPETTSTEASLRLDRVSGAVLTQTVLGKLLDYGTIQLEAPGDHPAVRNLVNIPSPAKFYAALRAVVFAEQSGAVDPDDMPPTHLTARLPKHSA